VTTIDPLFALLHHPWPQQHQQQQSSWCEDDNAIIGISNLVLRSTQQSTNTRGEQMGRMGGNNGDGQGRPMREEMDTPANNAEGQVPAPPPAINNQHER